MKIKLHEKIFRWNIVEVKICGSTVIQLIVPSITAPTIIVIARDSTNISCSLWYVVGKPWRWNPAMYYVGLCMHCACVYVCVRACVYEICVYMCVHACVWGTGWGGLHSRYMIWVYTVNCSLNHCTHNNSDRDSTNISDMLWESLECHSLPQWVAWLPQPPPPHLKPHCKF